MSKFIFILLLSLISFPQTTDAQAGALTRVFRKTVVSKPSSLYPKGRVNHFYNVNGKWTNNYRVGTKLKTPSPKINYSNQALKLKTANTKLSTLRHGMKAKSTPKAYQLPRTQQKIQSKDFSTIRKTNAESLASSQSTTKKRIFERKKQEQAALTAKRIEEQRVLGNKIIGFKKHGVNQAIGSKGRKGVKPIAILDALRSPIKVGKIKVDHLGRHGQRFVGKHGEVVVNPWTRKVVSVNPTSSSKRKRLMTKKGSK